MLLPTLPEDLYRTQDTAAKLSARCASRRGRFRAPFGPASPQPPPPALPLRELLRELTPSSVVPRVSHPLYCPDPPRPPWSPRETPACPFRGICRVRERAWPRRTTGLWPG